VLHLGIGPLVKTASVRGIQCHGVLLKYRLTRWRGCELNRCLPRLTATIVLEPAFRPDPRRLLEE
jgi:hypothetical protein